MEEYRNLMTNLELADKSTIYRRCYISSGIIRPVEEYPNAYILVKTDKQSTKGEGKFTIDNCKFRPITTETELPIFARDDQLTQ